ncbi:carbonic anhydrase [Microbacterium sp. LKL04]|uniref:Carbonic anhydrase n=1 Tax=Microbacterium oleivorans TaxID=273677 RepID=A0A4R5YKI8_9MICO|nr:MULTISPECIES: carbonic anhydrase [Microbacterium]MDQ1127730.1 carbonic anhydrase [Microbacterium sp. SORGH_AS_0505]TDL43804.1 carbonic anhydrase [Microbacterium oleivorans]SCY29388.1 carbonic anhydrase [Microbacterium sp. LKL04]
MSAHPTPSDVWSSMLAGNRRFVAGEPEHPRQDAERRHELAHVQRPTAALFGCSDSRLAAEIIFDEGLGDLFVIRNAGQVISDSVVGSLEYAVAVLGVPLIVVLGHDECGAVRAAIDSTAPDAPALPAGIWRQVAPIVPAVRRVLQASPGTTSATVDAEEVGREHLRDTIAGILHSSELISDAVAEGRLAVVGANYRLADGTAIPDVVVGEAG